MFTDKADTSLLNECGVSIDYSTCSGPLLYGIKWEDSRSNLRWNIYCETHYKQRIKEFDLKPNQIDQNEFAVYLVYSNKER